MGARKGSPTPGTPDTQDTVRHLHPGHCETLAFSVRVRARLKVRSAAWALARVPSHLVLLTPWTL